MPSRPGRWGLVGCTNRRIPAPPSIYWQNPSVAIGEVRGAVTIRAGSPRWKEVNASAWEHERVGLYQIRDLLPDADPYCAWANVEFVGTDGSVNEVDLLVLTPSGLVLLELKHWQGEIGGDGIRWQRRMPNGRTSVVENPLLLANRKAKRLASLLGHYAGRQHGRGVRVPYVGAAVYLHAASMKVSLDEIGRQHIYRPTGKARGDLPAIGDLLVGRSGDGQIDRERGRAIVRLIESAGVRPATVERTVGQLKLESRPYAEGPGWQDYLADHKVQTGQKRRVRFYLTSQAAAVDRDMIVRAAEREYRILQDIHHDGIVHAVDLVEHEYGPAVVFEHDEESVRLDRWMDEHGATLQIDQRLNLLRQLAETMQYAHSRRLVHRNLNPHSILVRRPDTAAPRLVVIDWQTGGRLPGSSGSAGSLGGTLHVEQLANEASRVYQAPEIGLPDAAATPLDVFSLGCVAYLILTGRPPAITVAEQRSRLDEAGGLDVSAAFDGATAALIDLVFYATVGVVPDRTPSVARFLTGLDQVEEELTAPDPVPELSPLDARTGDQLEGGFTVVKRLGAGATAVALEVRLEGSRPEGLSAPIRPGQRLVLKVALDEGKRQRLIDEADVLERLKHYQVAQLLMAPRVIGGHTALLLEWAGEPTLAEQLATGGRLNIEALERYGTDLLDIVRALDALGVMHRDIKPANLAARPRPKDSELHLCIFDFSLAAIPAEQWQAGTQPYRDPFLGPPRRARYDAAAERFSVAVTLYEMATGALPRWGDGASDPALLAEEVTIDPGLFDPSIAERLAEFFRRALAREARERFDTVEEMADAWRATFSALPPPATVAELPDLQVPYDAAKFPLGPGTLVEHIGLSPKARSALERFGVSTVAELIGHDAMALSRLGGVSKATKQEITRRAADMRMLFPTQEPVAAWVAEVTGRGLERLADMLAPALPRPTNESRTLRLLLGLDSPAETAAPLLWPSQTEVARAIGVTAQRVGQIAHRAAERGLPVDALTEVRDEIVALLDANGGVMSADELAEELIAGHGSFSPEPLRASQAVGIVRAAVETELVRGGDARVDIRRSGGTVLVGLEPADPTSTHTAQELLEYVAGLARAAQRLAAAEPLPAPKRAVERLRQLTPPPMMPPLSDQRLVQLAAAGAGDVAVNAESQLYPVGLPPDVAIRLAAGTLAVRPGGSFTEDEVRRRIRARFPQAAPLPPRPALNKLLTDCGIALAWDRDRYRPPTATGSDLFATATRFGSTSFGPLLAPGFGVVTETDERLRSTLDRNGFLAVLVKPASLTGARRALLARLGADGPAPVEVDVTRILVETLRDIGVPWSLVLDSDAQGPPHPDRRNLENAVRHAVLPRIEEALTAPGPVVLTEAAPLARYHCMDLIGRLADNARPRPAARLLLAPATGARAMLDDEPIPTTSPAQLLWLADAWWQAAPLASSGKVRA